MYTILRKTSILLLVLYYGCGVGVCQTKRIDSLNRLLDDDRVEKVTVLLELSRSFNIIGDYDQALRLAESAVTYAESSHDSLSMTSAFRLKGVALRKLERLDESITALELAYNMASNNSFNTELKYISNSLGLIYTSRAQYDKALEYNFQSLLLREKENDPMEVSITLNNIGLVYSHLRNYTRALEFYYRALEIRKQMGDDYDLDRLLINIGIAEIYSGRYKIAITRVNEALRVCEDECNDFILIEAWNALGIAYYRLDAIEEAKKYLQLSLAKAEELDYSRFIIENNLLLGAIAVQQELYAVAESRLKMATSMATTGGYNQLLLEIYEQFFILYDSTNDLAAQNRFQKKYIQLSDSLISADLVNNIAKIQVGFEERENLKTIREKDQILSLKEEIIARQRAQYGFILTIAVLAILLVIVLVRSNREQRKINEELAIAKTSIEEKNSQLQLINTVLDQRVQDRTAELEQANIKLYKAIGELDNFIYKTSHDIRGPLASLKGLTNVAMMDVRDMTAKKYLNMLDASADKLNSILTRLTVVNHINHVTPNPCKVDFEILINAILAEERRKVLPPNLSISYEINPDAVLHTDISVLKIALEHIIHNAIKFYSTSERITPFVKIEVDNVDNGNVEIRVIDNGIGIQESDREKLFQMFMRASERSETGGIGLYLAKLASEKLGGTLTFTETAERYTQFAMELPSRWSEEMTKRIEEEQRRALMFTNEGSTEPTPIT